jgi:hypothetical protein
MRAAAFAFAILLGGTAAVAQTTDTGTTAQTPTTANMDQGQPTTTTTDPTVTTDTTGTTGQTQTGWSSTTGTTGMTMASNATGTVVQPSNAAPERDARGIPVISAPAIVPIGYNGTTGEAMGGPLLDPTTGQPIADSSTRACTRTVTDHCLQTYERHRAR